eukprot:3709019-Pleurochrysis_carterae.AAC.1
MSYSVRKFNLSMLVDVEAVGKELLALPIRAECVMPDIVAATPVIDYGEVFRAHPYVRTLTVRNRSPLPAKFEMVAQDAAAFSIG